MEVLEYTLRASKLLKLAEEIENAKRPAYVIGDSDVHKNFTSVGERVGITRGQVLAVHLLKHIDAITAALCNSDIPQAESLDSRFADALNYLKLGFAMLQEEQESRQRALALADALPASPPAPTLLDQVRRAVHDEQMRYAPESARVHVLDPPTQRLGVLRGWSDRGIGAPVESAKMLDPDKLGQ